LNDAYNLSHSISNDVIVEEIVNGHHCDVNGLFINGEFHRCGIMDRFFSEPPYHYPIYGVQPSKLSEREESEVYRLVESAANVLGVQDGPIKGDVIYTADGPVLLELTPRFHGDVSTQFVTPSAIGFNPVELWFDILNGKGLTPVHRKTSYAGWKALFADDVGTIQSIEGVSKALEIPEVTDIFISKSIGDVIPQAIDNRAMCGFIWAHAQDLDTLLNKMEKAASKINFIVQ
jgi:biotin carboxylase